MSSEDFHQHYSLPEPKKRGFVVTRCAEEYLTQGKSLKDAVAAQLAVFTQHDPSGVLDFNPRYDAWCQFLDSVYQGNYGMTAELMQAVEDTRRAVREYNLGSASNSDFYLCAEVGTCTLNMKS